jgi:hypothetical protein
MCGPADFEALQTCIVRVLALSSAGLGTYVVRQTVQALSDLRGKKPERLEAVPAADSCDVLARGGHAEYSSR